MTIKVVGADQDDDDDHLLLFGSLRLNLLFICCICRTN